MWDSPSVVIAVDIIYQDDNISPNINKLFRPESWQFGRQVRHAHCAALWIHVFKLFLNNLFIYIYIQWQHLTYLKTCWNVIMHKQIFSVGQK